MASENPFYQRFNDSVVPTSNHTPVWDGLRSTAPGRDARLRRQPRPYWETDLSGCLLNEEQKDALIAQQFRNAGVRPLLMRVHPFCEIGTVTFGAQGQKIVTPVPLGVGTGTEKVYQLRKRLFVPGYEAEENYYIVKHPHYDYPDLLNIAGNIWKPMEEITIYLNGVLLDQSQWELDRDTGQVVATVTGTVSAKGGFYILMLLPGRVPIGSDPEHVGLWKIGAGVTMVEPPGGK